VRRLEHAKRRTLSLLERGFLGPLIALVAFLVERRLVRAMKKRGAAR
jgi:hypothetical protein